MTPEQVFLTQCEAFLFGAVVTGILIVCFGVFYDLYLDRKNADQTIKELREENERLKGENNEN